MTAFRLCLFALLLVGCPTDSTVDEATDPSWSLVALYDGATAARLGEHPPGEAFTWQAWSALEDACGRPKGPVGLGGTMDAELMARAQEPYLAVLLAGPAGLPITNRSMRVFVGDPRTPFWLAPAVLPRALALDIAVEQTVDAPGPDATKMVEQLRSQLTVQLCLEHQVGRGWEGLGGIPGLTARDMQNTFMLDKVPSEDRRLFVGQGASAAPLLGPPWWAPSWSSEGEPVQVSGTALSASDLFAFSPPRASPDEAPAWAGGLWPDRWLDLALGGSPCPDCRWVPAGGEGTTELALTVHRGECGLELSARAQLGSGERIDWLAGQRTEIPVVVPGEDFQTLPDVLRSVPYEYPRFESVPAGGEGERALAVLLIPNWQLANAAAEQEGGGTNWKAPLGPEPRDGVGWILEHPELLHVIEVPPGVSLDAPSSAPARQPGEGCGPALMAASPDAASAADVPVIELMAGLHKPRRLGPWGPSPDFRANAAPIVAAGVDSISPRQQRAAVRRGTGNLVLLAAVILLFFAIPGLVRLPNLWSARPRERAWGWPSHKQKSAREVVDKASQAGGGGS